MTRFQLLVSEILDKFSEQSRQVILMIELGLKALDEGCYESVREVRLLEREVNNREIEIESECLRALALYHPAATDLRFISMAFKANSDLERIADLALNLTERAEALTKLGDVEIPEELSFMTRFAIDMVKDAHTAMMNRDTKLAREICRRDDQLDAENRELITVIADQMEGDPKKVKPLLHIFSASRIIERIGDHSTNIAEDVLYLVEGDIQRHKYKFVPLDSYSNVEDYNASWD